MLYDVYQGRSKTAITNDESRLPAELGPWRKVKSLNVNANDGPRIGASSEDIVNGVAKDGYLLWPQDEVVGGQDAGG